MHKLRCVVALAAGAAAASAQDVCTEAHKGVVFTACPEGDHSADGARAVEYWKAECDSMAAGAAALQPPRAIPCDLDCPNGQYYDPKALQCTDCAAGTYSVASTLKLENFASGELPERVATYCHAPSGVVACRAWRAENGVLHSGDNAENVDLQSSLVIVVDSHAEGEAEVRIEYRIESEQNTASLLVYVDDAKASDVTSITGLDYVWEELVLRVSKGTHIIRLTYAKTSARAIGGDRAYVRSISVGGQPGAVSQCVPCAPGTYTNATGASECPVCPANTKRAADDADGCVPCGADEQAPPGAVRCTPLKECSFPVYGRCSAAGGGAAQRPLSWQQEGCKSDKPDTTVDCAACPEHFFRNEHGKCVRCPAGEVLSFDEAGEPRCTRCTAGTYPAQALLYDGFDALEGLSPTEGFHSEDSAVAVTNTCRWAWNCRPKEEDGNNAWMIRKMDVAGEPKVVLSSGLGHGGSVTVTFELDVTANDKGSLDFEYFFDGSTNCVKGHFAVPELGKQWDLELDHNLAAAAPLGRFTDLAPDSAVALEPGKRYTLRWVFEKKCPASQIHESSLNIATLSVTGVVGGGAGECKACLEGYKCDMAGPAATRVPQACPPGTYQPAAGQSECLPCPAGEVAKFAGSVKCATCAPAAASAAQDRCIATCQLTDAASGAAYDLTPIGNTLFGPIIDRKQLLRKIESEGAPDDEDFANQETSDQYSIQRYYMKLCEGVNDDDKEQVFCPSEKFAYVCQRLNAHWAYSMGDWAEYTVLEGSAGVNITFTGGSVCNHAHGGGYPRKTLLQMKCDPAVTTLTPDLEFLGEDQCDYSFRISTSHACPLCRNESFFATTGACDPATRQAKQVWHKKKGHSTCIGTKADTQVACRVPCGPEDWEEQWQECAPDGMQSSVWTVKDDMDCIIEGKGPVDGATGGVLPASAPRSCIGAQKMQFGAIIALCVFIVLVLVICVVYRKKRLLEHKYSMLSQGSTGHEMDAQNVVHDDLDDDIAA
eukprot:TRINITY_DN6624_c2_g1_i1.p1 TRINITY_DN6624_c2_g1~~TRINITY_DN6624_c2_g1_i1.p1  ORF type:complete len:997 (+),score=320.71 TRINITY_DN6624_c2_g1_i1:357-3347(+)